MFRQVINLFRVLFPVLFASQLPHLKSGGISSGGHFPRGRFNFYGRTNGASRRRKSNKLRIPKQRRLKHRHK